MLPWPICLPLPGNSIPTVTACTAGTGSWLLVIAGVHCPLVFAFDQADTATQRRLRGLQAQSVSVARLWMDSSGRLLVEIEGRWHRCVAISRSAAGCASLIVSQIRTVNIFRTLRAGSSARLQLQGGCSRPHAAIPGDRSPPTRRFDLDRAYAVSARDAVASCACLSAGLSDRTPTRWTSVQRDAGRPGTCRLKRARSRARTRTRS